MSTGRDAAVLPSLHLITDAELLSDDAFVARASALLERLAGAVALHVRGHGLAGATMYQRALSLAPAAAATGALLLVNDRVDVAMTVGAAGVQLGRRSLPVADARRLLGERAWIGWSAHGAAEAAQAEADGADFCVVGTVYQTTSHTDRPPLGLAPFGAIARRLARPAIAIGGITPARVAEVIAAGAAGVAVLSGVWHAHDPLAAADEYRRALEGAGKP